MTSWHRYGVIEASRRFTRCFKSTFASDVNNSHCNASRVKKGSFTSYWCLKIFETYCIMSGSLWERLKTSAGRGTAPTKPGQTVVALAPVITRAVSEINHQKVQPTLCSVNKPRSAAVVITRDGHAAIVVPLTSRRCCHLWRHATGKFMACSNVACIVQL